MGSAIAVAATDQLQPRAWGSSSYTSTVVDDEADEQEEIITLNANSPTATAELIAFLRECNADVKSGTTCRLTRVIGNQFYVRATRGQFERIHGWLAERYPPQPRPAARAEDFVSVARWDPSHEISLFVDKDRPGVLAAAFDVIARHGVNVVTMAAATGTAINPDSDTPREVATFWEDFRMVARREGWKKASVVPLKSKDRDDEYRWSREREIDNGA
jgi:hypothetical protein